MDRGTLFLSLTSVQPLGLDWRVETAPLLLIPLAFIPCMADPPMPLACLGTV